MKKIFKYFKAFDWLFIALVLFIIVLFVRFTWEHRSSKATYLKVSSLGRTYLYQLIDDTVVEIQGRIGITKIQIKNATACVLDSPCPNKTCMARPPITQSGEWIICLPNEVYLKIEAESASNDIVLP